MGALSDALKNVQKHAFQTETILDKIRNVGQPGSRLTPARSSRNDARVGARLDFGSNFTKDGKQYQNVNFQLNKDADESSIRALVKQNGTHTKYAEVPVLISPPNVPTTKVDKEGKKVPLSQKEMQAAEKVELRKRTNQLFVDMFSALK